MAFAAETRLPTERGTFRVRIYKDVTSGADITVLVFGSVDGARGLPVRIHDQCMTSEVLGSLKCDCKDQLDFAIAFLQQNPPGMVIYLPQEGRGIGLSNKVAAYALQEEGFDTVDANRKLGLGDDERCYDSVPAILDDNGVRSIALMTNNPRKIEAVQKLGVVVAKRIPCVTAVRSAAAKHYLETKTARMGHLQDVDFSALAAAVAALQQGNPVIVMDDASRENEGDLVLAAQHATPAQMAFMVRHTTGIVCAAMTAARAQQLRLPLMVPENTDKHQTAFAVSCDAVTTSTGVSAADRATTLRCLANAQTTPAMLSRPGHIYPLIAHAGGLKKRRGHTEAGVELCRRAGLVEVAVIAELTNDDGTMKRLNDCATFAAKYDIPLITVQQLLDIDFF